jgi:uncharacterized integral membrane protein
MDVISIFRQYRIGPFTIFDTVTAYVGIFLIAPLLTKIFSKIHINFSRAGWLWLTLPISVIFHLIFRQNTPFMKMLLNPHQFQFYLGIIILLFMSYMGLRKIKTLK